MAASHLVGKTPVDPPGTCPKWHSTDRRRSKLAAPRNDSATGRSSYLTLLRRVLSDGRLPRAVWGHLLWFTAASILSRIDISPTATNALPAGTLLAAESDKTRDGRPPERVRIGAKLAVVRSGPGRDFYPTEALTAGDWVSVVKEQGEWLAILPPAESFCWVEGDKIQLEETAGKGRVLVDHTPAWIGSALVVMEEHVFQTELHTGDVVEVLDVKTVGKSDGRPEHQAQWLKIRPPQGDLRWIEKQAVAPSKEDRPSGDAPSPSTDGEQRADRPSTDHADRLSERAEGDSDSWFPRWASHRVRQPLAHSRETPPKGDQPTPGDLFFGTQGAGGSFDDRCVWLHVQLSKAAARAATAHEWASLADAARQLQSQATTSHDRQRAKQLLARAEQLQELVKKRARLEGTALALPPAPADEVVGRGLRADRVVSPRLPDRENPRPARSDTPYVAEGWLMPVASLQRPAPPFVVMDAEGQPIAFCTPAPGLNLRRYIDRRVGIVGQPGFAVLNKPHVIAHRVVLLDSEGTDSLFSDKR